MAVEGESMVLGVPKRLPGLISEKTDPGIFRVDLEDCDINVARPLESGSGVFTSGKVLNSGPNAIDGSA